MKNKLRKKALIIGLIVMYIMSSFLVVREYNWNRQNITSPETPIEIAREFMQPRYNYHWRFLMGMNYAGRNSENNVANIYEIGNFYKDYTMFYDMIIEDQVLEKLGVEVGWKVGCKREIRDDRLKISSNYFYGVDYIDEIYGRVKVYNDKEGCWKTIYFGLEYTDDKYIVAGWFDEGLKNEKEIEKYTQMTIDEIVAIAYEDQENLEKVLYKMQRRTLYAETIRLIIEVIALTIGIVWALRKIANKELMDEKKNRNKSTIKK